MCSNKFFFLGFVILSLATGLKAEPKFDENLNCIENCGDENELPKNCDEALNKNGQKDGVYVLKIAELPKPFGVHCVSYDNKGWIVIQRRQDGSVDFYRNWEAYKNGFGDLNGEYWLGLERISQLIPKHKMNRKEGKRHELCMQLETVDNKNIKAHYSEMFVDSESYGYALSVDGFTGDIKDDALNMDSGRKFVTFDRDYDEAPDKNCAKRQKGAWWFNGCSLSNLNGEYKKYDDFTGLWWHGGTQEPESLKTVQIAIHPVA